MLILPTPEPHNPRTRLLVWFLFMKGFFEGLITVQFVHLYCGINDWHETDFKGLYIFSSTPCFTCTVTKNCYWVSWQFFSGSNICSWNTGNSTSKILSLGLLEMLISPWEYIACPYTPAGTEYTEQPGEENGHARVLTHTKHLTFSSLHFLPGTETE